MNVRLLHGAPPGAIGATSPSGWINSSTEFFWFSFWHTVNLSI